MRRILTAQLKSAVALTALVLVGVVVGGVLMAHQRLNPPAWVPFIGKSEFVLRAQLDSVQGVLPGQGQAVTISGVRVGQIGAVSLEHGIAVANLLIDKRYAHVYPNATVLLRPKTQLKDMVAELDPGTPASGHALASGALLRSDHTAADVNLEEILAMLDRDTRDYLDELVGNAGEALSNGGGRDLAGVFRHFDPLSRHIEQASHLVALRRQRLRRLVGNLSQLATELGSRDRDIVRFVRGTEGVFRRLASQSDSLQQTVDLLPPALGSANRALAKVTTLGQTLRGAATKLDPAAQALAPTLAQVRPFLRRTTPVFRDSLRPFSRGARTTVKLVAPASARLAGATPPLKTLSDVLNSIVNEVAYKPKNENSYLFYVPWASHDTNSVLSWQDGIGPMRRGMILVSCSSLGILDTLASPSRNPTLATLIQLLAEPSRKDVCNAGAAAKAGSP
jgi:phospholipid/cholesterol/gamma-HCH transport system substrate-binding protein